MICPICFENTVMMYESYFLHYGYFFPGPEYQERDSEPSGIEDDHFYCHECIQTLANDEDEATRICLYGAPYLVGGI
jgi:hypothetical protein